MPPLAFEISKGGLSPRDSLDRDWRKLRDSTLNRSAWGARSEKYPLDQGAHAVSKTKRHADGLRTVSQEEVSP